MQIQFILLASIVSVQSSVFVENALRKTYFGLKYIEQSVSKRQRRNINWNEQSNIIRCAFKCIVPTIFLIMEESLSINSLEMDANRNNLDSMCRVFRNASTCEDSCHYEPIRDTFKDVSNVLKFICVDRYQEFRRHLPCLNKATVESGFRCSTQCVTYKTMESLFLNQISKLVKQRTKRYANYNGGPSLDRFLSELLKQSCQFSNCTFDCTKNIVNSFCGSDAQALMEDLITTSYKSLQQVSFSTGLNLNLPTECVESQKTSIQTNFTTSYLHVPATSTTSSSFVRTVYFQTQGPHYNFLLNEPFKKAIVTREKNRH